MPRKRKPKKRLRRRAKLDLDDMQTAAAYHEAGHAAAVLDIGGAVRYLTIRPDPEDFPDTGGLMGHDFALGYDEQPDKQTFSQDYAYYSILMLLAGITADALVLNKSIPAMDVSILRLREVSPESYHDDFNRIEHYLDMATADIHDDQHNKLARQDIYLQAAMAVRQGLEENWALVEALAQGLLKHKTLDQGQIDKIAKRHLNPDKQRPARPGNKPGQIVVKI